MRMALTKLFQLLLLISHVFVSAEAMQVDKARTLGQEIPGAGYAGALLGAAMGIATIGFGMGIRYVDEPTYLPVFRNFCKEVCKLNSGYQSDDITLTIGCQNAGEWALFFNLFLDQLPSDIPDQNKFPIGVLYFQNGIQNFPTHIKEFKYLRILCISNSPISFLPDSIGELRYLENLCCTDTNIERLPSTLQRCQMLSSINMDCTNLREIKPWLLQKPLKYLSFKLTPLHSAFDNHVVWLTLKAKNPVFLAVTFSSDYNDIAERTDVIKKSLEPYFALKNTIKRAILVRLAKKESLLTHLLWELREAICALMLSVYMQDMLEFAQ